MRLCADKLRLIVTGKCNLDCFYCHNEGQAKENTFLELTLASRVLESLAHSSVAIEEITISGGEPMLHPDLIEIVGMCSEAARSVTMVTNGVLFTTADVHALSRAGLRKLRVGVDSLRPRKPRPSPGLLEVPFEPAKLVREAKAAGLDVDINVVITKFNQSEIGALTRFAISHGVNAKFFEHVEVDDFGADGHGGTMQPDPRSSVEEFRSAVETELGSSLALRPAPNFGDANLSANVGSVELRYCRYLCPFNLCWITGTRLDPLGYVYNCMVNRGLDRVGEADSVEAIGRAIQRASSRPCRSAPDQLLVLR